MDHSRRQIAYFSQYARWNGWMHFFLMKMDGCMDVEVQLIRPICYTPSCNSAGRIGGGQNYWYGSPPPSDSTPEGRGADDDWSVPRANAPAFSTAPAGGRSGAAGTTSRRSTGRDERRGTRTGARRVAAGKVLTKWPESDGAGSWIA